MEISEFIAYAKETYQIEEQKKWDSFPGFSVLCHPKTGKWVALLMQQWDGESGTMIERCDIKCGNVSFTSKPYLSRAIRMKGTIGSMSPLMREPKEMLYSTCLTKR